ncbi:MAG: pilus assembly protein PilP [Gammaproteobacteria bacterium]
MNGRAGRLAALLPASGFARNLKASAPRAAVLMIVVTGLGGCGNDMSDLELYVDEVMTRKAPKIEAPPLIEPYVAVDYTTADARDPFDPSVIETPEEVERTQSNSGVQPPTDRTPEFLESFPLDSLRMVGTLSRGPTLWALVKTPDQTIQRVAQGNYVGQNYGKITQVTEATIDILEIIPNGSGGWEERQGSIALSEQP